MKIVSIVGARPQFIKLAPFIKAVDNYVEGKVEIEHIIIHTGQHYEYGLSKVFFDELEIPVPDFNLNIGSGTHGDQTGRMLIEIEKVLNQINPDIVVVFGDTNSTLAGAVSASKLNFPVAHIEAGLRSFNRRMPEEINRIVADHLSEILLAPTPAAVENLNNEGLGNKTVFSGDIMYDAILLFKELASSKSEVLEKTGLIPGNYILATIHRAENTDHNENLRNLLIALNKISEEFFPIIFPVHPRTAKRIKEQLTEFTFNKNLMFVDPLPYLDIIKLLANSSIVLTDSGGLQKEAFLSGIPCVTLRNETEWIETVNAGGNIIAGSDPKKIIDAVKHWKKYLKNNKSDFSADVKKYFGNGDAANLILNQIINFHINSNIIY